MLLLIDPAAAPSLSLATSPLPLFFFFSSACMLICVSCDVDTHSESNKDFCCRIKREKNSNKEHEKKKKEIVASAESARPCWLASRLKGARQKLERELEDRIADLLFTVYVPLQKEIKKKDAPESVSPCTCRVNKQTKVSVALSRSHLLLLEA